MARAPWCRVGGTGRVVGPRRPDPHQTLQPRQRRLLDQVGGLPEVGRPDREPLTIVGAGGLDQTGVGGEYAIDCPELALVGRVGARRLGKRARRVAATGMAVLVAFIRGFVRTRRRRSATSGST